MWKSIPNFTDYEASDCGRIRSVRPRQGSRALINNGIISGWVQTIKGEYKRHMVTLRKNGKTYHITVAQIILETFLGPRPDGYVCRHINGNPLDNRIENLKWGTQEQNVKDSILHGTKTPPPVLSGSKHHNAKLNSDQVEKIRRHEFKKGDQAKLARHYNVSEQTIRRIRLNLTRING